MDVLVLGQRKAGTDLGINQGTNGLQDLDQRHLKAVCATLSDRCGQSLTYELAVLSRGGVREGCHRLVSWRSNSHLAQTSHDWTLTPEIF